MSRHIVGAFEGVGVEGIILWDQSGEPGFEIVSDVRISFFLDEQAG